LELGLTKFLLVLGDIAQGNAVKPQARLAELTTVDIDWDVTPLATTNRTASANCCWDRGRKTAGRDFSGNRYSICARKCRSLAAWKGNRTLRANGRELRSKRRR
jgi:hypothetical protein